MWDVGRACALAGPDLQEGVGGFGDDVPAAPADLVQRIRSEDTTICVRHPAKQFCEDGVLKWLVPSAELSV